MERLWAPWRMEYLKNLQPEGCIFCLAKDSGNDRERLVLRRSPHCLVMLNRYPYCNGHLMVAPNRHTADLNDLSTEEVLDIHRTVTLSVNVLKNKFCPQGFNIGLNLGKIAGAGIDDHLHIHVVPRWVGDTNFMTVIADVRVMPENLLTTYDKLCPGFSAEE